MKKTARFTPPGEDPLLGMSCSSRRTSEGQKLRTPSRVLIVDPADNETDDFRRKKAPNWTSEESSTLMHGLIEERNKLRAKHAGSGGTEQDRQDAWVRVYDKVNAISRYGRSLEACQSKSTHFVSETRLKYLRLKKQVGATGGGSIDPVDMLKPHEQLALEYGGLTMTRGLLGVPDLFKSNKWSTSKSAAPPRKRDRTPTATISKPEPEKEPLSLRPRTIFLGNDADCSEPVNVTEDAEDAKDSVDGKRQVDLSDASYFDGDDDQDLDWELPAGALKSECDSSEFSTPPNSVPPRPQFSVAAKARHCALEQLMPNNQSTMKENAKIADQLKAQDEARAAALFKLTQERMKKKMKELCKCKEDNDLEPTSKRARMEENLEGNAVSVPEEPNVDTKPKCCPCSEMYIKLLMRIVRVGEKLVENEQSRLDATKEIKDAVVSLHGVIVDGPTTNISRDKEVVQKVLTQLELETSDGDVASVVTPSSSLEVVDDDVDGLITVVVEENSPPKVKSSTTTNGPICHEASTSHAELPDATKPRTSQNEHPVLSATSNEVDNTCGPKKKVDNKNKRKEKPFKPPARRKKNMKKN